VPAPPTVGPALLVGALNVLVGGIPVLRLGDCGFALACLGSPAFEIQTGSSSVFVGGKRAARSLDLTKKCPLGGAAVTAATRFSHVMHLVGLAGIATGALAHGAAAA